jgi:hypothetical protein
MWANYSSFGQQAILDSCGRDKNSKLNVFEIAYLNTVFFADTTHNFTKGFQFRNKNVAFFTCDSQVSDDGFIPKDIFFEIIKSSGYRRSRGLFVLNASQQNEVGHLDAVVIIDCKAFREAELISRLKNRKN